MSNVPTASESENPVTPHPMLQRLLELRGWTPNNPLDPFSEETQLATLVISFWAETLLTGRVQINEADRYAKGSYIPIRCWKLGNQPLGDTREEAKEMLAWLGLAHLPQEWIPIPDVDNSKELIEAKYSHFAEYDRAVRW